MEKNLILDPQVGQVKGSLSPIVLTLATALFTLFTLE